MFVCYYCDKELKNGNSKRSHESRCKFRNEQEKPKQKTEWSDEMRFKHSSKMKSCNTNAQRIYTENQLKNLSEKSKAFNAEYWTDEKRMEHSNKQKQFVKDNPELYNRVCGRAKVFEVLNLNNDTLKVRGSWEKIFVEWCNSMNILCMVPNTSFEYQFEGNTRMYFPDFYLPLYDIWVEVKGYETEKDRCKWRDFPHKLMVLKKKEIKTMQDREAVNSWVS